MPRDRSCQLMRVLWMGSSHKDCYYILRAFELCSIGIKRDDSRLMHSKQWLQQPYGSSKHRNFDAFSIQIWVEKTRHEPNFQNFVMQYSCKPKQSSRTTFRNRLAEWGSLIWLNFKHVCTIDFTAYFWTCKSGRHHKRDACLVPKDETCLWYMKQRAEVVHVPHFRAHPKWFSTIPMMPTLHPCSVRRAMRSSLSYDFAVEQKSHGAQFHGLCP